MAQKVEINRHAMATGALPMIQRSSAHGQQARAESDKSGSGEPEPGK